MKRRDSTERTPTVGTSDLLGVRVIVSTDTLATHPTNGHSIHSELFVKRVLLLYDRRRGLRPVIRIRLRDTQETIEDF
jgi:hypothetical protein